MWCKNLLRNADFYLSNLPNVFVQIDKYICCTSTANQIPSQPSWSRWPALVVMVNWWESWWYHQYSLVGDHHWREQWQSVIKSTNTLPIRRRHYYLLLVVCIITGMQIYTFIVDIFNKHYFTTDIIKHCFLHSFISFRAKTLLVFMLALPFHFWQNIFFLQLTMMTTVYRQLKQLTLCGVVKPIHSPIS